jgi:hypothetical protein
MDVEEHSCGLCGGTGPEEWRFAELKRDVEKLGEGGRSFLGAWLEARLDSEPAGGGYGSMVEVGFFMDHVDG